MSDDGACKFPAQDERDYYKLYRERITVEDQRISYRVSWLLVSQAIMFSVWASAFFGEKGRQITLVGTIALAVVGVIICGVVYAGVLAALAAIGQLKGKYKGHQRNDERDRLLPDLVSEGCTSFCGRIGPYVLPPLFAVAWVAVVVIAVLESNGFRGLTP